MTRLLPTLPFLVLAGVALGIFGAPGTSADEARGGLKLVDAATRTAIQRGTEYLVGLQLPNGAWPSDAGKKVNDRYVTQKENVPHVGVTSLAVLALLAGGHLPGRGRYGKAMEDGVDFILSCVQPSGFISKEMTRMYSHALATLALGEVYGITRRQRVRERLQDAIEFTIKSQNKTGGWRYVPFTSDSDMSVTVCQVVALRAARNVGIKVPRPTIDRALRYVMTSTVIDDRDGRPTGAFYYQPEDLQFNRDSFALCAAALTTLFQAGLYDDDALRLQARALKIKPDRIPSIQRSVDYMREQYHEIHTRRGGPNHYFYYYGNYYAAQAMYQIGGSRPALWRSWYQMVRKDLMRMKIETIDRKTKRKVAFWRSNVDTTNAYGTANALLILQFPLDHLPIHQR